MASSLRLVFGQISHETNTFSPISTALPEFRERGLHHDEQIFSVYKGTRTSMGGFIDASEQSHIKVHLVPSVAASAVPSGIVTKEAHEHLLGHLLDTIQSAMRSGGIDGVLLALHGAMVSEHVTDAEADILYRVRQQVGTDIPVVVTLDLHGNITSKMVSYADAFFGFDTNPHVDSYERAVEATECMLRTLSGEITPVMAIAKRPMMPPTINMRTKEGPMVRLFELAREHEAHPDVINVSVFGGFPFADIPEVGSSVVAVTNGNPQFAERIAEEIADEAWKLRAEFLKPLRSAREAVAYAMSRSKQSSHKKGPIVLADVADNCGGGGSGDTTVLLKTLLEMRAEDTGFAIMWDPEAAMLAHQAGPGARIALRLGGKTEPNHGEPLEVEATVKRVTDGRFVNTGPMQTGLEVALGKTALLQVDGIEVITISQRMAPNDPEIFRHVGIDPEKKSVLVVKSRGHFRAGYEPLASEIVEVDCPGMASPNLSWFAYKNVPRPLFPLDNT